MFVPRIIQLVFFFFPMATSLLHSLIKLLLRDNQEINPSNNYTSGDIIPKTHARTVIISALITGAWRKLQISLGAQRLRTDGGSMFGLTAADNGWKSCQIWFHSKIDSFPQPHKQSRREKVGRGLSFIKRGRVSSKARWVTVMTERSEVKGWGHV